MQPVHTTGPTLVVVSIGVVVVVDVDGGVGVVSVVVVMVVVGVHDVANGGQSRVAKSLKSLHTPNTFLQYPAPSRQPVHLTAPGTRDSTVVELVVVVDAIADGDAVAFAGPLVVSATGEHDVYPVAHVCVSSLANLWQKFALFLQ